MTITVNASTSKKITTYQFTRLTLQSTASTVRWEIEEYPIGLNNSDVIKFEDTSNQVSVSNPAYMTLVLAGTYVLKVTESNNTPVYIYVEAESLSSSTYLPYNGERDEIDNINGWGNKLFKGVETALMSASNSAVIKTVIDANTKDIGSSGGSSPDLTGILAPYSNESNNIIYNGNDVVTDGLFGIIIQKYTVTNTELFGSGKPLDGKAFFQVLQFGTVVLDYDCNITTVSPTDDRFFYNQGTGTLTNSITDTYVGRWDSTNYILTIENPDPTNRVISAGGAGSAVYTDSIAFIDSTYSTDDPTTHTYKTFAGAVNNEPENTTFFFMTDGQSFTISSPLTLKWGQKFYNLFSPISGINLNLQSTIESYAQTINISTRDTANIFSIGIKLNVISSSLVFLALRDSFLQINQYTNCFTMDVDAYESLIYLTIDSTSANVDLGDVYFYLTNSIFALYTTDDNSSYYNSVNVYSQGDFLDSANDFDNNVTIGSDAFASSETTQYVKNAYITIEGGSPRYVLAMADFIDLTIDNGCLEYLYADCASIDILAYGSSQIEQVASLIKEYQDPTPSRRAYYMSVTNNGKIPTIVIDKSAFLTLPNTTHVFDELISSNENPSSLTQYRIDLFSNASFTAANFVGMVGMSVAQNIMNLSSQLTYYNLDLSSDVFYTTDKYFNLISSFSNVGSIGAKPKFIIHVEDGTTLSVDFGNTVVGTISEKILIYTTDLLAGTYDIPFDISIDNLIINSTSDANPRTVQIYVNNDATRGNLVDLNLKNINIISDDISVYVCETSNSNIKLNYSDDGSNNVLYLNGERNTYLFHGTNDGDVSTGSASATVPVNIFIEKLIQSVRIDLVIDHSYVTLKDCLINDLTINAGKQHCIGLGNIINGTFTDNGSNNLFYDTVNEGGEPAPFISGAGTVTDNTVVRFDGTTGRAVQDSSITIADDDTIANIKQIILNNAPTSIGSSEATIYWNDTEYTLNIVTGIGPVLQTGQEFFVICANNTGLLISNGTVVYPLGTGDANGFPYIGLAKGDSFETLSVAIGITTMDIPDGGIGFVNIGGSVNNLNTSTLSTGPVYVSTTVAGGFQSTVPEFPNYKAQIGVCTKVDASNGRIIVDRDSSPCKIVHDGYDGTTKEKFTFTVTSNGTVITGSLENKADNTRDMVLNFSDGFYRLDTTPADTVTLTAGTDTNPQENYIYIPKSTKTLTASISGWPTEEHISIAKIYLQSATTTQTDGVLKNHNWNDYIKAVGDGGFLQNIARAIREKIGATWLSGVQGTATITTNAGAADNVNVATTGGIVMQMHEQTVAAMDTAVSTPILIVNDNTTPFKRVTDLNGELTDASGNSMSGNAFSLVVWAVANSAGETPHLMCNLPTSSYTIGPQNPLQSAIDDINNYATYDIPAEFQGTGFLIARFTFEHSTADSGTWSLEDTEDLRGKIPNLSAGGAAGGSGVTEWTALTDTPSTYSGQAGKVPSVNSGESALEFINIPAEIPIVVGDEDTALTIGTAKYTFRMPYAMTLTEVRANVKTAPTDANIEVDINEGGVSVLSTVISIDATEKTSTTAATPPVISDASLADDAEITIDIDQVGSTIAGSGLKLWLIGYRS